MGIHAKAKENRAIKILAFACMVAADPVEAADRTWNAGTGDWDVGANWTPANEPAANEKVFINNDGTAQVSSINNVSSAITLGSGVSNAGTLAIFGGGQLTSGAAVNLGLGVGATGTATIDGAGSFWRIGNALVVGNGGTGTINITNGGLLYTATGSAIAIGNPAGSTGIITVDGAGSTFRGNVPTNNTALRVGGLGTGTLTVSNGGTVSNFGAIALGALAGGTGTMTITDAGSTVTTGAVTIGAAGQGTLSILNGGVLNGGAAVVGSATISGLPLSTATIDGAGSRWTASGGLSVGVASNGNVFVTNGGVLESSGGTIGGSTGAGLIEIDNGTWNAQNATGQAVISVGAGGIGTLRLLNGGTAQTSNRLIVGSGANSNGSMLIDNASFTLLPQSAGVQANTTEIGRDVGTGSLTVQNGSTVVLNSTLQLGTRLTTGDGTLIVQDAGTTVTATGAFSVGQNGTGHFRLLNGAVMNTGNFISAGSTSGDSVIDNATLNVAGNGLAATGRLGVRGTATLDIQNGGVVNMTAGAINDLEIAQDAGSAGILTIGGTGGTLNVDQVIGGKQAFNGGVIVQGGTATVNFNHTNAGQAFDPRLRGFMTVNQMNTGTTILGGDGDYVGTTHVSGGILRAGIANAFSENSDYVVTTGNLELNNLDNEIGSLSGNGNVILGTGTLTTGSTQSTAWSGDISGTGGLTKTGATVFTLDSVQSYTGLTTVRQGILRAGVANAIAASSGLTVHGGTEFNMGRFDQSIGGDVINNGLISFGAIGNELTINGDLSGNGMFFMETDVAAGIGDHVTVTGTSAGSHLLRILNTGNTPSPTQVLEVVDTTDGVARFAAVGGTVDVGLYAYEVVRGDALGLDPTNWYLGNTRQSSEGARAILNTAAGLSNTWFTQMDNLHRRMGQQRLVDPGARGHDVWVRGYSRKIEVDDSVSGRPFDEYINGIDVGIDTVARTDEVDTWLVGAFAGYGKTDRDFNDFGSDGKSRTPYAGLYGTWFNKNGYYVDATFKVQYFDNEFDAVDGSGNRHQGDYDRWGIGGGIEAGRRFYIGEGGWSIQPQAQVQYVYLNSDQHTTDRNVHVELEGNHIWQLRAGLEGGREITNAKGGIWYPYGRVSVIEQYSKGNKLTADGLSFTPRLTGTSLEYGVGVIYQADDRRQGYLAFTTGNGDHYDTPWAINAGLRYEF